MARSQPAEDQSCGEILVQLAKDGDGPVVAESCEEAVGAAAAAERTWSRSAVSKRTVIAVACAMCSSHHIWSSVNRAPACSCLASQLRKRPSMVEA